ncbi:hypothetical protein Metbo_1479 [Methanobacterium lacus]|uniref:Uncharacterized protein n=1 Tax=Methanobacterium lacus (strain AL-21) TaxID=877455 RepID=F0T8G2_METLA|nr:hypothetical protein Metbo_1479 [Methanobacterium lacus]
MEYDLSLKRLKKDYLSLITCEKIIITNNGLIRLRYNISDEEIKDNPLDLNVIGETTINLPFQ